MESITKKKVQCFLCGNVGHKSRYCKRMMNRMFRELNSGALATQVYDSRHKSRSPMVRSSTDNESTQSVNNMSLTERDLASEVVETFAVYIGNIPNDWDYNKVKFHILSKTKRHIQVRDKYMSVIILKGKYHEPTCKVAKVIFEDQEFAKVAVEQLTNEECNENKLEVTQDPEASFLKDIDLNTIDKENEIRSKICVTRNKLQQSDPHAAHGPIRDHNFKRKESGAFLYGLTREYLRSLDITPPLRSSIFVTGFDPEKVNNEKLREVFSLAGQVVTTSIFRDKDGTPKNCAIILFDHPIEAVQAISMFHNESLYGDNLTVNLASRPKLPEGLTKLGPGLGPGGKPMRNVRTTIEMEPLKRILHKKLSNNTTDSPQTNLEKYVFNDAYFQQNVPTMAGSNQTVADPMTLNAALNTMIQNAAVSIITQNSVMNPAALNSAVSAMTQNGAMNHMIQNAATNPMIQNTVMNSIVVNDTMNPMAQNAGMNPMIHNPSVNSMAQNANMNPMTQNAGMNPMIYNPSINSMAQNANMNLTTQNAGMNPMTQNVDMYQIIQNAGVNQMTQNADMNPVVQNAVMNPITQNVVMNPITQNVDMNQIIQNAGVNQMTQNADMNPVVQNAVSVNPTAQNHDFIGTNSMNGHMQNNAQQNNSCDSEGKDNAENEKGSHILLFTNLPPSVDQRGLKSKMREIGQLVFVKLMEQGRAVVSYEKSKDALKCISIFHKCKVDGQVIEVQSL